MISSIALLLLQYSGTIQSEVSMGFWKWYLPICAIEVIVYFRSLFWWGEK